MIWFYIFTKITLVVTWRLDCGCNCGRLGWGRVGDERTIEEAESIKVVQREDSGSDKNDSNEGHEQWSDSGCYVECQAG